MAHFQLIPLKDDKQFEYFVCDLMNCIENTESYQNTDFQIFGVSGQSQKGIDIISQKHKTVVQCKLKLLTVQDKKISKNLIKDINDDLAKSQVTQLILPFAL